MLQNIIYYEIREIASHNLSIVNKVYAMKELKLNKIDMSLDFSSVKEKELIFKIDKECYDCSVVLSRNKDYIYIYLKHGSNSPYDNKVTNVDTFQKTENKNNHKEALLVKQVFFFIDTKNNVLYSSVSSKYKDKIISLIAKSLDINIKNIKINFSPVKLEEFLESVNDIKDIQTWLYNPDLFHPDLFNRKDLFNKGEVDYFFSIKVKERKIVDKIKNWIFANKNVLKKMKIVATDKDSQLQKVFKADILYESIDILVDYNNGMYDEKDVYNALKKEINNNVY